MGWLMVAITPMFIMTLMTSLAFTAMRCASSATVIGLADLHIALDRRGGTLEAVLAS